MADSDSDSQLKINDCVTCVESGMLQLEISHACSHANFDSNPKVLTPSSTDFDGDGKEKDTDSYSYCTNWSDMIPEILSIILKSLEFVDNVRFRCVCKNWYSADLASHPRPPFLLLPGDDTGTSDWFQFLDISHQSFYKIHLPQLRNRRCLGSSEGKLIYMDERAELHVLDPVTGSHYDLPSITTLPGVGEPVFDGDGNVTGYFILNRRVGREPDIIQTSYFINNYFNKVIICPRTSVIAAICKKEGLVAFCLPGDQSWTLIQAEHPDPEELFIHGYQDIVFYKDVLYSITYHSQFGSFHLGDGHDLKTIRFEFVGQYSHEKSFRWIFGDVFWYLVEADGDLLLVWRYTRDIRKSNIRGKIRLDDITKTEEVEVRKVNWGTMQWEEITCIGEYALFLGFNCSFSISTRDFPGLKANNIYFTDDNLLNHAIRRHTSLDVGVFNLEDRSMKPCYDGQQLTWPPPVWFIPKGFPLRHSRAN